MSYTNYEFILKPLPYSFDALEPFIDAKTLQIHHDKHLLNYVNKLNNVLRDHKEFWDWPLEKLLKYNCFLPNSIKRDVKVNAGGVYNHNFYFDIMMPDNNGKIKNGNLFNDIVSKFGSFDNFKMKFKKSGMDRVGSGYAWLVIDAFYNLNIISTLNQDAPILFGLEPVLCVDVWEHAYYLKYQNRRDEYLENWFNLIDWNKCDEIYSKLIEKRQSSK